jgi:hypothetical protein
VQFDIFGTGQAVATGWVGQGDGLLALDRNHDGSINDASELFGSATRLADGSRAPDGYYALATLDSTGDGSIDRADAAYDELRVWVDDNSDGISEAAELHTLDSLHIRAISTVAVQGSDVQFGNKLGLTSTWLRDDGVNMASADVWFVAQPAPGGLQQQVSALSQALKEFIAPATPSVNAGGLAGGTGAGSALPQQVDALASALDRYQTAPGQAGPAPRLGTKLGTEGPEGSKDGDWFTVPRK